MPSRPVFVGRRKEFLEKELQGYADAVANGTKEDHSKNILRRYFKRFPPDFPHNREPSAAHLAAVNDALPDQEPPRPDPCNYPEDQETYYALEKAFEQRVEEVKLRSGQVLRWLHYNQQKRQSAATSDDPYDFLSIMKCRLLGKDFKKPRKNAAFHVWCRANKDAIDKAYRQAMPGIHHIDLKLRGKLAMDMYKAEAQNVHDQAEQMAVKKHEDEVQVWREILTTNPPTDSKMRQACIDKTSAFLQPIFDMLVDYTGMRLTFMMGGPEPADHGRLNVISIHAGVTKGPIKMNFGEAESEGYESQVVPVFSNFLRKCYTREDYSPNVTYCPAAGENYGPPDQSSANSSDTAKKQRPRPSDVVAGTQTGSSAKKQGSVNDSARQDPATEGPSAPRRMPKVSQDSTSNKCKSSAKTSNAASPAKEDDVNLSQHPSADVEETGNGNEDFRDLFGSPTPRRQINSLPPLSPATQLDPNGFNSASPRGALPPRPSSPSADDLPVSPTNSRASPPTSVPPLHLSEADVTGAKGNMASAVADAASHGSSADKPPRCGPPGIRSDGSTKKWRVKQSRAPVATQPPPALVTSPTNTGVSMPVKRPPTASARTLVPTFSVEHSGSTSSTTSLTKVSNLSMPAALGASNDRQRSLHHSELSSASAGASPANTMPFSEVRRLRRQAAAADRFNWGGRRREMDVDKENLMSREEEGYGSGDAQDPSPKRTADAPLNEPGPKRRKTTSLPRLTTGGKRPRLAGVDTVDDPSPYPPTSPSSFSSWELPPDAPDAVKQTLQLVRFGAWGSRWNGLVTAWLAFERPRGYPTDQRLGNKHRPPAVSEWIQRARAPKYRPAYKAHEYQMMFWKWWIALQPDWRSIEADTTSREVGGGWNALDKAGTNGFTSVMAALFFWGCTIEEEGVGRASWNCAIDDVCWVLTQLAHPA